MIVLALVRIVLLSPSVVADTLTPVIRHSLGMAGTLMVAQLAQSQTVTATDRVRIRERPDFTSRTTAVTTAGDSLTLIAADSDRHGFYHVRGRKPAVSGWVASDYLAGPAVEAKREPTGEANAAGGACGGHCGTQRWAVKTLSDNDRNQVNFTPVSGTVSALVSRTVPSVLPDNGRADAAEKTTYRIRAILIGWKQENEPKGDLDFHLVIADPGAPSVTMIAEVPSPGCSLVCATPEATQYQHIRDDLVKRFGTPGSRFQRFPQPVPIVITGVAFFDFLHGQVGHADNAIELHPVLDIK